MQLRSAHRALHNTMSRHCQRVLKVPSDSANTKQTEREIRAKAEEKESGSAGSKSKFPQVTGQSFTFERGQARYFRSSLSNFSAGVDKYRQGKRPTKCRFLTTLFRALRIDVVTVTRRAIIVDKDRWKNRKSDRWAVAVLSSARVFRAYPDRLEYALALQSTRRTREKNQKTKTNKPNKRANHRGRKKMQKLKCSLQIDFQKKKKKPQFFLANFLAHTHTHTHVHTRTHAPNKPPSRKRSPHSLVEHGEEASDQRPARKVEGVRVESLSHCNNSLNSQY